ncbi:MAG: NADH-quinone oxidoreductase subunit C [Bacteroidetes bacterium]|nr:NADH-quinone oxidoreductase subunit C [Bacteroidota bacterium]
MTKDELKIKFESLQEGLNFEEGTEWLTIPVESEGFKKFALLLRNDNELQFDYLFCLTAVDWKTHLSVVYHFSSTVFRHEVVIKVKIDKANPIVDTVCEIWRTAEFHEREAYDLLGVEFVGHPDLRRLFLTPDHEGFPLRKDYEDPINMIKL